MQSQNMTMQIAIEVYAIVYPELKFFMQNGEFTAKFPEVLKIKNEIKTTPNHMVFADCFETFHKVAVQHGGHSSCKQLLSRHVENPYYGDLIAMMLNIVTKMSEVDAIEEPILNTLSGENIHAMSKGIVSFRLKQHADLMRNTSTALNSAGTGFIILSAFIEAIVNPDARTPTIAYLQGMIGASNGYIRMTKRLLEILRDIENVH